MMSAKLDEIEARLKAYDKAREAIKGLPGRGEHSAAKTKAFMQASQAVRSDAPDDLRALLAVARAARAFLDHFDTSAWGDMNEQTSANYEALARAVVEIDKPVDSDSSSS